MKMSRRAERMQRHHKRRGTGGLNMVSLMDIFTILVFFLLVNQSAADLTPNTKIKLPEARASLDPKETIMISIDKDNIVVQGRKVASVQEVLASHDLVIPALKEELEFQHGEIAPGTDAAAAQKPITIVGDKELPYRLLKRLMVTCTQANYSNISLAVTMKSEKKG